jgi:acetoin:2,6-dichlorophenolindophenol oxidoreductase subunit alpha
VAVAVTGEGAANAGPFHESLNLAALWKLPVVFVVEDNDWGISVPRAQSTSVASNADRAAAYGIPGVRVEDNSVEAVYAAAAEAIARAGSGAGPTLIEVHTLRLWGHFEGDAEGYRPELKSVPEHDPIPIYRDRLLQTGALTDGQYQGMQASAVERVEDAIDFAKNSPTPDPLDHLSYVFSEGVNS